MKELIFKVADNSGILYAKCIRSLSFKNNNVKWGDVVVVFPRKTHASKLPKKKKYWGLVVGLSKLNRRKNGSCIKGFSNRILLVQETSYKFFGSRVFGPICRELRETKQQKSKYRKIISYSRGTI